ncbi:unnamed protein product [Strongylus vulgaris]|uniref:Superoxide dismutase [Cu-Zn] n=1 Tax=Strongylus vulgaris TaxID=40348 RepID=A0A3P7J6Z7_STRVU|nr:unnamed protein product [Strongylus vulgaris]
MLREILLAFYLIYYSSCCAPSAPQRAALRAQATMFRAVPGAYPSVPVGFVNFRQRGNRMLVNGRVVGLTPGFHGMHVHAIGDLGNGCLNAGPHYNPNNQTHGSRTSAIRHVGDLGNIFARQNGVARFRFFIGGGRLSLTGPQSIVGRTVVVHAGQDDLGQGTANDSSTTGNSGARVACGIIVPDRTG